MATAPIISNRTDKSLRMYGKYDRNGRLIPGSTVLRRTPPKGNDWVEILINTCCTETTQTPT